MYILLFYIGLWHIVNVSYQSLFFDILFKFVIINNTIEHDMISLVKVFSFLIKFIRRNIMKFGNNSNSR